MTGTCAICGRPATTSRGSTPLCAEQLCLAVALFKSRSQRTVGTPPSSSDVAEKVRNNTVARSGDVVKTNGEHWGPPLWDELHAVAFSGQLTPEYLEAFGQRISCGPCRDSWKKVLQKYPPQFGGQGFAWTVAAHNAVSRDLGKREWTEEEAAEVQKQKQVD